MPADRDASWKAARTAGLAFIAAAIGVSIAPGETVLMRMPSPASSMARLRLKFNAPALAAL